MFGLQSDVEPEVFNIFIQPLTCICVAIYGSMFHSIKDDPYYVSIFFVDDFRQDSKFSTLRESDTKLIVTRNVKRLF